MRCPCKPLAIIPFPMDVERLYSGSSGTADSSDGAGQGLLRVPSIGLSLLYPHLPSSSALAEGTRLLITGGMMEVYRQIFTWLARSVVDRFCITATFHDKDPIYSTSLLELAGRSLMMIRLAAVLAFALTYMAYVIKRYWESWVIHITTTGEARDIEVTTRHYGLETDRSMHPWLSTKDDPRDTGKAMSYLPREGKTYHMWYRRRLLLVSRREKTGVSSFQPQEMLRIRYVGPADMKFRRVSLTLGPGFSPLTTGFSVHFSMKLERSSKRPGTMSYQYGLLIRMS